MRTTKSDFFPLFIIAGFILILCFTSCEAQRIKPEDVNLIGDVIADVYEEPDGLHVITSDNSDILIELIDEQETYLFATDGKEYAIKYFRTGNDKQGCTGVYVVFKNELYRIDSHHKRFK